MKIITIAFALLLLGGVVAAQNPFNKVAISEVSSGDPDGVEIANFGTTTVDITGWIVRWWDPGTGNVASSPLNTTIAPNERIIITESNNYPEAPGGTKIYATLPGIGAVGAAFTVALEDAGGTVVDEVRVTSTAGAHPGNTFGGTFRGLATRSTLNVGSGAVSQERIWGLDSDAGADWTEQPNRSFGLINRNSGPRGSDNPIPDIRINEIDNSPDYIELYNASGSLVDLQGWFFLCDASNGGNPSVVRPFPGSFVIAAGGYVVIGDGATTPAELPGGTPYVNLAAVS